MDQANEQSYDVAEAADAYLDILAPEDSAEQPTAENADEPEEVIEAEDESAELDGDDDSDVDEDETELDDDEESDEEVDEDEDESPVYELGDDDLVTIDGQQITFKELREGSLRQADYTRKTQELAAQRQQFEQWAQQQGQGFEQQSQQLNALGQMLEQQVLADDQINWQQLASEDPSTYIQLKEQSQQRRDILNQLINHQQSQQYQQQVQTQEQHKQFVESQRQELLSMPAFKHWSDPQKAATHQSQMREYLLNAGLPESDVKGISSAKVLSLVDKAMKYDQLQASKPRTNKKVRQAPQMVKPKSRKSKNAQRQQQVTAQRKRLSQTGSLEDAASLLFDRV